MRTDNQIKQDILDELVFQPNIDEIQLGVMVDERVVTLTGIVDSYPKKYAAREAVQKVKGVRAIAEDLVVKHGEEFKKTDQGIAKVVANFLEWNSAVSESKLTIEVRNGYVYLTGEAKWSNKNRTYKEKVIRNIIGVKGVINDLVIQSILEPIEIKERITKAFKYLGNHDAENIIIEVDGHNVKLCGKVHSLAEKLEAGRAAYNTVGVCGIKNDIRVIN